ncbi:MAG: pseudouridine synthase [Pseudomonadota bacterium]|nr:pseudouridine synthase [Pseudomonadota bacterium]
MPLILFNKPFGVISQFSGNKKNLSEFIVNKSVYPAGRLDKKSEGLILLTNDGKLQARITEPAFKLKKHYWVQVEGAVLKSDIDKLKKGLQLKDGLAIAIEASIIDQPKPIWKRNPPIRDRNNITTTWINMVITEGKNHQIRRMTASINLPTLRLIRYQIGPWEINSIKLGENISISRKKAWSMLKKLD